jgi:hypothetical protein
MIDFIEFPKIARLNRECVATEKIDGTNASVYIGEELNGERGTFLVGSRTRWITPEQDNHGFARWAYDHEEELRTLGPGMHYGEWWGSGVQRGYGLQKGEKRFSLFNVHRWSDPAVRPACCHVVPELARGLDIREVTERALATLRAEGSRAAPGFAKPEGVVVFHTAGSHLFKVTLERDEAPKGKPLDDPNRRPSPVRSEG